MTLSELLPVLAGNNILNITLLNKTGKSIITFNAAGYQAIESDLGAYEVTEISVVSSSSINVSVEEAE